MFFHKMGENHFQGDAMQRVVGCGHWDNR
jgi:hypothetical protein